MIIHSQTSVLFVAEYNDSAILPFVSYLKSIPHLHPVVKPHLPDDLSAFDVIVTANTAAFTDN